MKGEKKDSSAQLTILFRVRLLIAMVGDVLGRFGYHPDAPATHQPDAPATAESSVNVNSTAESSSVVDVNYERHNVLADMRGWESDWMVIRESDWMVVRDGEVVVRDGGGVREPLDVKAALKKVRLSV